MSFMWVCQDGVCFDFVRFALLLPVVLFWVGCCYGSWVLPGPFFLLCVMPLPAGYGLTDCRTDNPPSWRMRCQI